MKIEPFLKVVRRRLINLAHFEINLFADTISISTRVIHSSE